MDEDIDKELFERAADHAFHTHEPQVVEQGAHKFLVCDEHYVTETAGMFSAEIGEIPNMPDPWLIGDNGTKIWVFTMPQVGNFGQGRIVSGRDMRFDHLAQWARIDGQIRMTERK